jgi:hypothetical protein
MAQIVDWNKTLELTQVCRHECNGPWSRPPIHDLQKLFKKLKWLLRGKNP